MKFFSQFKKDRSLTAVVPVRLDVLRLIELFRNIMKFFSLVDDGKDKSGGEYILDFHYVSSLVEEILGQMNMIVHSACILAPEGGADLFVKLDSIAKFAKERFVEIDRKHISGPETSSVESEHPADPEYLLLRQVLNWVEGGDSGSASSCMQLLHDVFGHVLDKELFKDVSDVNLPNVVTVNAGRNNIVSFMDFEGPEGDDSEFATAADALQNRTFALVAMGADREAEVRDSAPPPVKRWWAFLDSGNSNMILTDQDGRILLAVNQIGDQDLDFIFVLYGGNSAAEQLVSSGFKIDKAEFGSIAYIYNTPVEEMDEYLTDVGNSLFGVSGTKSFR
jgi:hypothetical protein